MTVAVEIVLASAVALLLIAIVWRLSSRYFALPCPSWLALLVEIENPLFASYNARNIIRRLELRQGMKVLDAGCGPGRVTIPLAQALGPQGEVVAIDLQERMLQRLQLRARAAGVTNIRCLLRPIEGAKLESNEYDRALLVTVLGEIPDRRSALREIFRGLKPGGILSVTEILFDPHYQSRGSILKVASQTGFEEAAFSGNRLSFTLQLRKP